MRKRWRSVPMHGGSSSGALDYVIHEGMPILLDANKTTGVDPTTSPELRERRRVHARGIESFFRD